MKTTSLITSVLSIALLLGGAAPALAHVEENGSDDTSVHASTSVSVNEDANDDSGEHEGLVKKLKLTASSTARMELEREKRASSTENRIVKVQTKASDSIDKRIKSLQDLSARLAGLKMLPADALANIQAALQAEIQTLVDLKAKVGSDTSTTTTKADAQSITKANRVYLLVIPKAQIASAASRIKAVVTQMEALSVKLQTRLTAAQTAGADITAASAALNDFNAKIADAKVQADAAVSETANLQVDNGDKTVLAANIAALKDARAKLNVAQKDLAAARADAAKIYSVVKGKEGKSGDHASSTESH